MIEGRNGLYKVTGLLDWDSVLSVPLVLAVACVSALGGFEAVR